MLNILKTTAKKTLKDISEDFAKSTINSVVSVTESLLGAKFVISSRNEFKKAEKILYKLSPKIFNLHCYESDAGSLLMIPDTKKTLKDRASFIIPLPESTYIFVNNRPSALEIFIFGKKFKRAAELFKNSMKAKKELNINTDNMVRVASTYIDDDSIVPNTMHRYHAKTLDEIFTSKENKNNIKSYISHWEKANELFSSLNITHKLGILLYGPPGTGKTSMAKAIGNYLDYPIFSVSVSALPDTPPNFSEILEDNDCCIILLEDIDYIFNKNSIERSSEEAGKANALLQMLDGANSSSNVIFIATTNSIESLNEAIIRDGRFDLKINMDNLDNYDVIKDMCRSMKLNDDQTDEILKDETLPINPAYLQNKCIKYIFSHFDTWDG